VEITGAPPRYYAGVTVRHGVRVTDASGAERDNVTVTWRSSDERVLSVDRFGDVTALRPGAATLTAAGGGVRGSARVRVVANPARTLTLTASRADARTGDVVRFRAVARNAAGQPVADLPITFSVKAQVEDTVIAPDAPAQVDRQGRFVAQRAGDYTVVATAGGLVARRTVAVGHRHRSVRLGEGKGQGAVRHAHTSDLWVWTGKDGRDYAVTGTWGASGVAYFWDVTDPASPALTDSVQVDARTVNDVKLDTERGLCVITREGASNRRNGFVVLDCANPRDVRILSRFDDGLYGGVHNVFVWNRHVFAINAGRRFDIISIEDPRNPKRVSWFELDTPGHGIHDVWVVDGIACTSNWQDGAVLIDVGNGIAGGSLTNPVQFAQYTYPLGAAHSCFPYRSPSTSKWYVFVGDEIFPYGLDPDEPEEAAGYIHVVDFTDHEHPVEVARYEIPEAGPHNFWLENDTLYVAYYNAGLRVVDVSGELMGNLYEQGRELARFQARDPNGKVANAPMAWGPQPHKGHVFFSDFNSGLWAVKLPERPAAPIP
ncbi:MAG: Ig-like domain-containing protein, partial [Gemmatimonadales bacterium]